MSGKIKVLVVDDSAFIRQTISGMLNSDPKIEVIGTAADPIFAAKKIVKDKPDVITLDLEMPRMNGLTFLRKIMSQLPIPVVIISSLTESSTQLGLKALTYGAVEVIPKPQLISDNIREESRIRLCDAVKAASVARINNKYRVTIAPEITPKYSADKIISYSQSIVISETTDKVIAIGASTGGTTAIQTILETMPPDCPGIVIVQHMPENFTKSFANRLNDICEITVREAVNGELITPGKALIAPGNKHLLVKRSGAKYKVEILEGPLVNRHRPSVDVLFRSVAKFVGKNALGIILTGMGDDGAKGLLEIKNAGAYTIAQDEKSCVVFGMPREAIKLEAAHAILPLDQITSFTYKKITKR